MDIHKDGVIVIPSQFKGRNGAMTDNLNFVYLTGLKRPDATLVLDPGGSPRETIFRRMRPEALRSARDDGLGRQIGRSRRAGPGEPGRGRSSPGQEPAAPDPGIVEKPNTQLSTTLLGLVRSGRAERVYLPFSDFDFLTRTFSTMGAVSPFWPNPIRSSTSIRPSPSCASPRMPTRSPPCAKPSTSRPRP